MNLRRNLIQIHVRSVWSGLILALLIMAGSELNAQGASAVAQLTIRGKVVSLKGSELVVATPNGDVKLTTGEKTCPCGEPALRHLFFAG